MSRRPLMVANWKMNGLQRDGVALVQAVLSALAPLATPRAQIVICPPATLLAPIGALVAGTPVALGGQDCHAKPSGAFTGDVAAVMLADLGCKYVIVGHSERRALHAEDDALICAKAVAAHGAGLTAIICIGESLADREAGRTLDVVTRQLDLCVPQASSPANTVIAYEPVWAIGTGKVATPTQVAEVHGAIRGRLARQVASGGDICLLYGGSVKPDNAAALLTLGDVDGALVGGASLDAAQFLEIAAHAARR